MKKRLCAGLLVLSMLLPMLTGWITPVRAAKVDPINVVDGTENNSVSAPYAKYATNEGAALKKLTFEQSGPWNLEIKATEVLSSCQTYVVILRYDLFDTNYNRDGDIGGIDAGSYTSLRPGTSNPNYYRTENQLAARGTAQSIFNQNLYNFNNDNSYKVGASSTTYHMKYAAIIFDGATKLGAKLTDYTIVTFYMNSEGYLQRDSYMLRYIPNAYPAGNGTVGSIPAYQIEDWKADAAVNTDTLPTRRGFKFLGWDPNDKLMPADANTAAANPATPKFPLRNAGPVAWTDISAKFAADYKTSDYEKNRDKFYNLYAVWQPNQVRFDYTNAAETLTVGGKPVHVLTLDSPQVGVAYNKIISLDISTNSTTDRNTAKTYSWINGVSAGAPLTNAENETVATTRNISNDFSITVTANGNTQWKISGTPGNHSDGKDVYTVLQVKDNDNNTTDWIILHFAEVKRRAQPIPAMDANTGLQSKIETIKVTNEESEETTEVEDGQIFGMYPTGPITMADNVDNTTGYVNPTGNVNTGTNGVSGSKNTGTMTGYYKALGMAYEYRPAKIQKDGQTLTLVDSEGKVTEAGEAYFASQPNGGWREVPYPLDWYAAAEKAKLAATMTKNSDQLLESAKVALTNMNQSPANNATATVRAAASPWPDEYGYIEFEAETNLPVIHGLNADDIYELRFKKNATSEVSQGRQISIGGAVAAGGGDTVSGGMAVNLAGGAIDGEDITAYTEFVENCHALTAGQSIEIPEWKPIRENYSFAGWTLGERDENGALILYNYVKPVTPGETTPTDPDEGDPESPDPGNKDPEENDPVTPVTPTEPVKVTMGDKPTALAAVWNATADGFIALTLYDWDDTLIGTKLVTKVENAAEQEALVQTAFTEIQSEYPYIFTSHPGYDFGCWIPAESDTPTAYGVRVQSGNANNMALDDATASDAMRQLNEPEDKVLPGAVTKNMTLKAAYVANADVLAVSDVVARQYTVTPVNYDRYGIAGILSITVEIERKNKDGQPVPRPATPALRVAMTANGVTTYSLFPLDGADVEQVEIVPFATTTGGVTQIQWSVVDTYGISNWAGDAGTRLDGSASTYTRGDPVRETLDGSNRQVLKREDRQFLYECYLGWVNSLCEQQDPADTKYASLSAINAIQLRTVGISTTGVTANDLKKKIYAAWYAKNYTDGVRNEVLQDLTKREMTDAIGTTANSIFSQGE